MDRRKFLGTVAGGLFVAPLDAAQEQAGSDSLVKDRGGMSTAVNFAGKVKGVNLTFKPSTSLQRAYWMEWDWSGWIRPQIDCAIALGANAIRILGDVAMVLDGAITQATYNARLRQLVAYCVENHLAFYYTGCSPYDANGGGNGTIAAYNANPQAFIGVLVSNLSALTSGTPDYTSSILGCDLVQEANAWGNTMAIDALYSAVRPLIPRMIPCTFSTTARMQDGQWIASIAASCDFLDYHVYPQLYGIGSEPTLTTVAAVRATYPDKNILFGEVGINSGAYTSAQVEAWIHGLISIGDSTHSRGAMLWAAQDHDQAYGAFDRTWYPRPSIAGPWLKWCRLPYLPDPRRSLDVATIPSLDAATIPPAASINAAGDVWTLGANMQHGKQVLLNGAPAAGGQATLLSWKNGQIKAQNNLGAWWLWRGNSWTPSSPP